MYNMWYMFYMVNANQGRTGGTLGERVLEIFAKSGTVGGFVLYYRFFKYHMFSIISPTIRLIKQRIYSQTVLLIIS